jgi:hypothetical protein
VHKRYTQGWHTFPVHAWVELYLHSFPPELDVAPYFLGHSVWVVKQDMMVLASAVLWHSSMLQLIQSNVMVVHNDTGLDGQPIWPLYTFPHLQRMVHMPCVLTATSSFMDQSKLETFLGGIPGSQLSQA